MPDRFALYSLIMSVIKAKSPKTIIRDIIETKNKKDKKILSPTTVFSLSIIVRIEEKWKIIIRITDIPAKFSALLTKISSISRLIVFISILINKNKVINKTQD